MPDESDRSVEARRKAKHRLSEMLTMAVGVVDRAANERTFLIVKRDIMAEQKIEKGDGADGTGTAAPEAATTSGLKLPAAAKQAFADGIAAALEKLAGVAEIVQSAEVDEAAQVPGELAAVLDEAADGLDTLADQFMPAGSDEIEQAKKPPTPPTPEADPAPGEADVAKDAAVMKAAAVEKVAIRKAGRRLAKARIAVLASAHEMVGKGHELIGNLIKEVAGTMGGASDEEKAKKPPAPPASDAVPPPPPPVVKVDLDGAAVAKAINAAIMPAVVAALSPVLKQFEELRASSALTPVQKGASDTHVPNSGATETTPVAPRASTDWPTDLAADAVRNKKAATSARS